MCRWSVTSRSYDSPASQVSDPQTEQEVDSWQWNMFHTSLPSSSLFEGAMRSSDGLVGSHSRQRVEQFREARLVRITLGGAAIGVNPFGILDPQGVANLLPELSISKDSVRESCWLTSK